MSDERDTLVELPAAPELRLLEADDTARVEAPGWLIAMSAEVDLEADALLDGDH